MTGGESFRPSPEDAQSVGGHESNEREKPSLWKRMVQSNEVRALVLLAATLAPNFAEAKGRADAAPKKAEAAETERGEVARNVSRIVETLKVKGGAGHINSRVPIRTMQTRDGSLVQAGYDSEDPNSKAQWLLEESADGALRYLDKNVDGQVDRVVLNQSKKRKGFETTDEDVPPRQKSAANDLPTFLSMDRMAQTVRLEADLDPQKILVFDIESGTEGPVVRTVDFETGEASVLVGDEAAEQAQKMQAAFESVTASHAAEIGQ